MAGASPQRRRGRPPAADPAVEKLEVRCTLAEKSAWKRAAGGGSLSAWARDVLNAAAKPG
ncbi:MAG: hypothetical protein IPM64_17935 [Phycisphaerales bacterium]|nr:hypothetical protein [Phycisphaerales bacterium]